VEASPAWRFIVGQIMRGSGWKPYDTSESRATTVGRRAWTGTIGVARAMIWAVVTVIVRTVWTLPRHLGRVGGGGGELSRCAGAAIAVAARGARRPRRRPRPAARARLPPPAGWLAAASAALAHRRPPPSCFRRMHGHKGRARIRADTAVALGGQLPAGAPRKRGMRASQQQQQQPAASSRLRRLERP
jgi:hypothetical protein